VVAAAPAGHQLAVGQRANVVAPSSPKSVFTLPRLQEPDDLAADGAGRTDCSLQEGNRVAFEGSQAELGGGGDGLAEQLPGPLKITRLAAVRSIRAHSSRVRASQVGAWMRW
jgi:hypothetical protein